MKLITLKVPGYKLQELSGKFRHLRVSGGEAYLTGGAARAYLRLALGMPWESPKDWDFTIFGDKKTSWEIDKGPRGEKRIEVEYESCKYSNWKQFFSTRDFTINQVVIDSRGNILTTEAALKAWKEGILELVPANFDEQRTPSRALKFSKRYSLKVARNLKRVIYATSKGGISK